MLEPLFNKAAGLKACNFVKKRLQHSCFPVNIAKFLRINFFYRTSLVAASTTGISQELYELLKGYKKVFTSSKKAFFHT